MKKIILAILMITPVLAHADCKVYAPDTTPTAVIERLRDHNWIPVSEENVDAEIKIVRGQNEIDYSISMESKTLGIIAKGGAKVYSTGWGNDGDTLGHIERMKRKAVKMSVKKFNSMLIDCTNH